MRIRLETPLRLLTGVTLATVVNLSVGACSPVVLQEDSDTETAGASSGGDTDGASSSATGGGAEGGAEGGSNDGPVPEACISLEPRVLGILETNCAKCHGPDGANLGGINYMLDLNRLIAEENVKPGDAAGSRIYARMIADNMPMPPADQMQRPTDTDIEIVGKWINECAGVQSCADQPFIPRSAMLKAINQDLGGVDIETQPFTRYFSFVHLYNAGWCDAEIQVFRDALAKLVNSLSHNTEIIAPVAIETLLDERGEKLNLVYRVDITDYKWQADAVPGQVVDISKPSFYFPNDPVGKTFKDVWEMMADQNPYTIEYIGDLATSIKKTTGTNFPVVPGDAFIDATSRSPLYYDILNIPLRSAQLDAEAPCGAKGTADECLETQLGINVLANIEKEKDEDKDLVGRAGFKKSDVSEFNRVVERHRFDDANNRVFWISYDFKGQVGDQNILSHPLDFKFDGGEIIFTLENGLQAYMLTDNLGNRLDEGPTEIVQDPSQVDDKVRNGVSCMGCHNAGIISVYDDIRHGLDAGTLGTIFNDQEVDDIEALYPLQEAFTKLQQQDTDRFNFSLTLAGLVPGGEKEPIITTFLSFDEDVTLRRVGAEYDLTEDDMKKNLVRLGDDLSDLAEGATVQRKDFTSGFSRGSCILEIGCTKACPGVSADAGNSESADRVCLFKDTDEDGIGDQP